MCTKCTYGWVLSDTLDWYPWSTSWSILYRHPDWYLVNTRSTLDQQLVDSWQSVHQLTFTNQKLVDSGPTVDHDVDRVPCEYWSGCQLNIDWDVNWEYQSRVTIDTQPPMPLLQRIHSCYRCQPFMTACYVFYYSSSTFGTWDTILYISV